MFKNRNFALKSNISPKIKMFLKNRTFSQKSNFFSKLEIIFKNWYGFRFWKFQFWAKFWFSSNLWIFEQNFRPQFRSWSIFRLFPFWTMFWIKLYNSFFIFPGFHNFIPFFSHSKKTFLSNNSRFVKIS